MVMLLSCLDCIPPETNPVSVEQTDGYQEGAKAIATSSLATPSIATPDAITQAEFAERSPQISTSVPTTEPNRAWVRSPAPPLQPLLRLGSRGEAVKELQTQLQQQGYYTDPIDGIFGRRTQAAVREWQRSHNLLDDGIVGSNTWAALSPLAPEASLEPFTTESPQISPSPSVEAPKASPETTPRPQNQQPAPITFEFETNSPAAVPWILGWAVIYSAGWVIIIRDGMHQHRVKRTKRTASSDSPSSSPPIPTPPLNPPQTPPPTQPPTTQPVTPPAQHEPVAIATPTPTPTPTPPPLAPPSPAPLPEMPLTEAIGEEIPIALANAGKLTSEDYLFPYLEDHDSDIIDLSDEQVVARLPATATDLEEEVFHYSLLDRAEGLFVLRGNELRVLKSRLARYSKGRPIRKTITIRRTSNRGEFIDKSFNLTLGKTA